jgi:cytochrome P450
MLEAVLILATLAQRYQPQLRPGHPVELWPTFTLRSRHGLPMVVRPLDAPVP